MKEKGLMTSFFLAGAVDVASTTYGLTLEGFNEVWIVGGPMVESGHFSNAALLRTAVTVSMIGMYALTKTHNSRWAFSFEKAMSIGNAICWGFNVFNVSQIVHHVATHIS
jgi:hypothetical protein